MLHQTEQVYSLSRPTVDTADWGRCCSSTGQTRTHPGLVIPPSTRRSFVGIWHLRRLFWGGAQKWTRCLRKVRPAATTAKTTPSAMDLLGLHRCGWRRVLAKARLCGYWPALARTHALCCRIVPDIAKFLLGKWHRFTGRALWLRLSWSLAELAHSALATAGSATKGRATWRPRERVRTSAPPWRQPRQRSIWARM